MGAVNPGSIPVGTRVRRTRPVPVDGQRELRMETPLSCACAANMESN